MFSKLLMQKINLGNLKCLLLGLKLPGPASEGLGWVRGFLQAVQEQGRHVMLGKSWSQAMVLLPPP